MTALGNGMEGPVHGVGLTRREARERSWDMVETVGMIDDTDQHPSRLSVGQRQRVATTQALVMRLKVRLFDEVTSALDPEVTAVIRRPVADYTHTMQMVTHEMGCARDISGRICLFFKGRIAEQGAPDRFFGNPRRGRTAAPRRAAAVLAASPSPD